MRTPEQVRFDYVQEWLLRSRRNLRAAKVLLDSGSEDVHDAVTFHSQQAVETALKSLLVRHQVEFPKTHDIAALRRLLSNANPVLAAALAVADVLTAYAISARYPVTAGDVSRERAAETLEIARRSIDLVTEALQPYLKAGRPS
jgi:HEPN domain-containing protein